MNNAALIACVSSCSGCLMDVGDFRFGVVGSNVVLPVVNSF